ncbi:transcriptional regulator family: Fungal Specific TF [Paecilomyces variotii]|nr:transcriptional regulator family: Fungal Specific TF [Paecilomyces variotii]
MDGGYVSPSGSLLMSDDLSSRPGSRSSSPKDCFLLDDPPRSDMDMTNSIAAELEIMFKENFGTECDAPKTNTYQERFSAFNAKVKGTERSASTETLSPRSTPLSPLNYRGLLSLLTQDLVETLVTKFGGLGCQPFFAEEGRFFTAGMAQDCTPAMFPPEPTGPNPLSEYDSHRTTQLIDVWFAMHPLSVMISKTLFLRAYRSNTHDEILLATMLADAHFASGDDTSRARGERLFDWASTRLRARTVQQADLSTAQALMLLGWHHTCLGKVRRAICYIGYAGRVTTKLKNRLLETPQKGLSRINGIDVGEVEEEMIGNIWWMTFSLTLWSFIQMDMPFSDLLPATTLSVFPPMDETWSVLIKLDKAADNLSTLRQQSATIREVWLLSHITSTAGHLYAIYPRSQEAMTVPQSVSWQATLVQRLRGLHTRQTGIATLCADARDVLLHVVSLVKSKVDDPLSQALMLTVYHTMLIHLLFPHSYQERAEIEVSETLMDDFTMSAKALLSVFPVREEMHKVASPVVAGSPCPFPHSYVLGLDACGRALDYFCTRFQEGTEAEIKILSENLSELLHLAQSMHALFKNDDVLLQDRRWRAVKKQLKSVRKRVEEFHRPGHSRTASVDSYATTTDESLVHTLSTGATSAASPTTTPLHAGFGSSVDLNNLSPLMFDNPMMPMSGSLPLSDDVPFLEEDVMSVPLNATLNDPAHSHDLWLGFTSGSTTSAADPSFYTSAFVDDFSSGIKRRNMSYSTVDNSAHIDALHNDPTFAPSMYLNFGMPTPVPSEIEHPPRKKARANTTPEPSMFSVPFHPAMSRT